MTAIVYVPGMLIGYAIIRGGALDGFAWHASGKLDAVLGTLWGPIVDIASTHCRGGRLPGRTRHDPRLVQPAGPRAAARERDATASKQARVAEAPVDDVRLGCLVASLTLSVSVALTVLVPLAAKGYVKREEALPYIMGANITTLADTLVVAMLQNTPVAAQIVLAEAIGVTIVSLVILAFFYSR